MKELLLGPTGVAPIVALVMGVIKKNWKPKNKHLYWIPALVLSAGGSAAVMLALGWSWPYFLSGAALIAGTQLALENEAFPGIKELWATIEEILLKVFKK